jgi:hypothetical protein
MADYGAHRGAGMSCCSHGKDQKKNVERKANEEIIEEIRYDHLKGSQSDNTNELVGPRRFGDESANAVENSRQNTEKRTP